MPSAACTLRVLEPLRGEQQAVRDVLAVVVVRGDREVVLRERHHELDLGPVAHHPRVLDLIPRDVGVAVAERAQRAAEPGARVPRALLGRVHRPQHRVGLLPQRGRRGAVAVAALDHAELHLIGRIVVVEIRRRMVDIEAVVAEVADRGSHDREVPRVAGLGLGQVLGRRAVEDERAARRVRRCERRCRRAGRDRGCGRARGDVHGVSAGVVNGARDLDVRVGRRRERERGIGDRGIGRRRGGVVDRDRDRQRRPVERGIAAARRDIGDHAADRTEHAEHRERDGPARLLRRRRRCRLRRRRGRERREQRLERRGTARRRRRTGRA